MMNSRRQLLKSGVALGSTLVLPRFAIAPRAQACPVPNWHPPTFLSPGPRTTTGKSCAMRSRDCFRGSWPRAKLPSSPASTNPKM